MGLETIVSDIRAKAEARAKEIDEEARREVDKILAEAESEAKKIKASREELAKKEIQRLRQQELSSANLEVKRMILNSKKEILDKVYQKTLEDIKNLPDKKNKDILQSLIKLHSGEGARIYSNARDEAFVKKASKLTYMGNIDCIGGIVIENEDGSVYLDYTYDTLIKDINEKSLKKISGILFECE